MLLHEMNNGPPHLCEHAVAEIDKEVIKMGWRLMKIGFEKRWFIKGKGVEGGVGVIAV